MVITTRPTPVPKPPVWFTCEHCKTRNKDIEKCGGCGAPRPERSDTTYSSILDYMKAVQPSAPAQQKKEPSRSAWTDFWENGPVAYVIGLIAILAMVVATTVSMK